MLQQIPLFSDSTQRRPPAQQYPRINRTVKRVPALPPAAQALYYPNHWKTIIRQGTPLKIISGGYPAGKGRIVHDAAACRQVTQADALQPRRNEVTKTGTKYRQLALFP